MDSHGVETLLKKYTATTGDDPIEIHLDLTGVNYLRIRVTSNAALYDVFLTPVG